MNRDIWKETLTENHAPRWSCPTCGTGFLRVKERPIKVYATKESRDASHADNFYQGDFTERFACVLECDQRSCAEPVSVLGITGQEEVPEYGEEGYEGHGWSRYLVPMFFDPPLALIDIPRACPREVRSELNAAFRLYWCHRGAAANRIRTVVELLLTHLRIKRFDVQHGRRRRLNLHQRIELFGASKPKLGGLLLAIKWLGNEGSHPGALSRDDLLDGFQIVEQVLDELLNPARPEVQRIAKQIVRAKGPRSRIKPRH
jgi:hypothetical protein